MINPIERRTSTYLEAFNHEIGTTNVSQIKVQILSKLENVQTSGYDTDLGEISCICLLKDNTHVVLSGSRQIYLYDLLSQKIVYTIEDAHKDDISGLVLSKNDEYLVSASFDGSIKVWNLENKDLLHRLDNNLPYKITAIALAEEENCIIACSQGDIHIWDLNAQSLIHTIENGHQEEISNSRYLKNGGKIITTSIDKTIKIWKFGCWDLLYSFEEAHVSPILGLAVTENERYAITTSKNGSISIWDVNIYDHICAFSNAHKDGIQGVAISNDNRFIVCASWDQAVSVWDIEARTHLHTFTEVATRELTGLVLTRDNRFIICVDMDGRIYYLDIFAQVKNHELQKVDASPIEDLKLSRDNSWIVSIEADGTINVWSFKTRELWHTFKSEGEKEFRTIDISPDNNTIASGAADRSIDLWDIMKKEHICSFERSHRGEILCVSFSNDGSKLVSCCTQELICVWDVRQKALKYRIEDAHENWITCVIFTNDGQYVLSSSNDKSIKVWDYEQEECVHTFANAHKERIRSIKLTSDDQLLVSCSFDRTIKVWNLQTKNFVHKFQGCHRGRIFGLSISRDNKFLVSGDNDHNLALYSLSTKQHVYTFYTEAKSAKYVAMTSDSKGFVYSADDTIKVLENPAFGLTIVNSSEFSPFSPFRFMPVSSYFLNTNLEHRKKLIKNYPKLRIFPYGWSWFHIAAIYSPQKELIQSCIDAQIPFEIDMFKKTPLHYLINNEVVDRISINNIIGRLCSILKNHPRPSELLESMSDIMYKLIKLHSNQVTQFLKMSVVEPETIGNCDLELFGSLPGDTKRRYHLSESRICSYQTHLNLYIKPGIRKFRIRNLPFHWNYSKSSDDMYNLVMTLLEVKNQEVFETKAISVLINYLWSQSKNYHYFYGTLFFVLAVLISIYSATGGRYLFLEVPIFLLGVFFLMYETFEVASIGFSAYFTMIWNYVDCFGTLILPPSMIAIWCGAEGDLKEWLVSFMIVYAYSRLVSYFRVFDQTRKLIRTIIEILRDMRSFAVILTVTTFGLALIFQQFDRSKTFGESLLEAYNLLYYSYDTTGYNVGQMFYFVVVTILATMVLLNMLLAMMWDSYGRVQEKSVLTDSQELLDLIEENMNMSRAIERLFCRFRRQRSSSDYERLRGERYSAPRGEGNHQKYLFFVEEAEEEEEELVTRTITQVETQIEPKKKGAKNEGEVLLERIKVSAKQHLLHKTPKKKKLPLKMKSNQILEKDESLLVSGEDMNNRMTNLENKIERLENHINQKFTELFDLINNKKNL